MLEHNHRSICQSRKQDSAGELGTSVFTRYSGVTGVSLWLLKRPGGSFFGSKKVASGGHIQTMSTIRRQPRESTLLMTGCRVKRLREGRLGSPESIGQVQPSPGCDQAWMSVKYLPANFAFASSPSWRVLHRRHLLLASCQKRKPLLLSKVCQHLFPVRQFSKELSSPRIQ